MKKITMILLSALLLNPATVFATSGGFVEAIQMPAWMTAMAELTR